MPKILITGVTGFIGSNLLRNLLNSKNNEIFILLRNNSNTWRINDIISKTNKIIINLNDQKLKEEINKIKPDIIYHCATYGALPQEKDFNQTIDTNILGSINLLNSCLENDFSLFVNISSSSEYGPKKNPMSETDTLNPITNYGLSKVIFTNYASNIGKIHKKNIVTIRLFSPFGYYESKGRLFPSLLLDIINNQNPKLGNPKSSRDFIFIEDVIEFLNMISNINIQFDGEVFNLGTGKQHSVQEIAEIAIKLSKNKLTPIYQNIEERSYDTSFWVADMEKSYNTFNWKPKYDLSESIRLLLNWFKINKELYHG